MFRRGTVFPSFFSGYRMEILEISPDEYDIITGMMILNSGIL